MIRRSRRTGSRRPAFPSRASILTAALALFALGLAEPAAAQPLAGPPAAPKAPAARLLEDGSYELAFDVPAGLALRLAAWHPAGARVAVYASAPEYGDGLWVDRGRGLEGPFERVDDPVFSADGRRVAFAAMTGYDDWWVLEGGNRSGPWADVVRTAFSPDSSRFLFLGYSKDSGNTEVVVDFESRGPGSGPGFFSGSRWFFRAWEGGMSVVTDVGVSGPWAYVPNVRVSPDGSDILYSATDEQGRLSICTADHVYGPFPGTPPAAARGPERDGIVMDLSALPFLEPGFGPDGHTPRFFVREERGAGFVWTVYDGAAVAGGPWAEPANLAARPVPSPDLKRVAFIVRDGAKFRIEESAGRLGPFADVRKLSYSADGSTFAAQVRGADWDEWIYGSGFKLGPYGFIDSWELALDGSLVAVWNGNRYDSSSVTSYWTRDGRQVPPGAARVPDPILFGDGPYSESVPGGALIRSGERSFGPFADLHRIYAGTPGGGVLYERGYDRDWTLHADGKLLLALPGGRLDESSWNLADGLVPVMAEWRVVACVAFAGSLARGLTIVDPDSGTGRWMPLGGTE